MSLYNLMFGQNPKSAAILATLGLTQSDVGRFRVPYVHGLTIGELAHMAKEAPRASAERDAIPEAVRERGRLTVIPMRGWTRAMRWTETGLAWVPTSPGIPDFAAEAVNESGHWMLYTSADQGHQAFNQLFSSKRTFLGKTVGIKSLTPSFH